MSAISDFSVDFSDDSVEFFDKDNTPLFVSENYKLNYDNNVEQVFLSATKNQERALSKSVDAECTFGSVKVESKQSIDNVLQRENSSIGDAYSTFARYNYNLRYYYDYVDDYWNNSVATKTVSTINSTYNSPVLSSNYFETNYAHYESFAVTFHNANYINYAKLQRIDTIDEVLYNTNYSIFSPNVTAVFHINAGEKTCFILSNISSVYNAMTYTVRFIH